MAAGARLRRLRRKASHHRPHVSAPAWVRAHVRTYPVHSSDKRPKLLREHVTSKSVQCCSAPDATPGGIAPNSNHTSARNHTRGAGPSNSNHWRSAHERSPWHAAHERSPWHNTAALAAPGTRRQPPTRAPIQSRTSSDIAPGSAAADLDGDPYDCIVTSRQRSPARSLPVHAEAVPR